MSPTELSGYFDRYACLLYAFAFSSSLDTAAAEEAVVGSFCAFAREGVGNSTGESVEQQLIRLVRTVGRREAPACPATPSGDQRQEPASWPADVESRRRALSVFARLPLAEREALAQVRFGSSPANLAAGTDGESVRARAIRGLRHFHQLLSSRANVV